MGRRTRWEKYHPIEAKFTPRPFSRYKMTVVHRVKRAAHNSKFANDLGHAASHPLRQDNLRILERLAIQKQHSSNALHHVAV